MKLGPNQTKWVEALESGEWKQAKGWLHEDGCYCCLGVAAVLFGHTDKPVGMTAPKYVQEALCINGKEAALPLTTPLQVREGHPHYFLSNANDCGVTFAEIAAFIRANPEAVFTESK